MLQCVVAIHCVIHCDMTVYLTRDYETGAYESSASQLTLVLINDSRATGVLQCVAVCCSVLQCVAVCCSSGSFTRDMTVYLTREHESTGSQLNIGTHT